jgi:hypothetical protein
MKRASWTVLALAVLSAGGCMATGPGGWGDVLADIGGMGGVGDRGGTVRGDVEWIDARRQEMELRASFGQRARVSFDSRTQVVYRGQRQSVNSLSTGDRVVALVERGGRQGDVYARQITVEEWTRDERDGGGWEQARSQRFDGQVGWVDAQQGRFQLRASRATYVVSLPYNASNSTIDRFRRLRAGNSVRIQGELLGNGRVELERFL